MRHLWETKWAAGHEKDIETKDSDVIDQTILMTLQEWSLFFVRELAKQMYIPQSMIHR
jgi:hypothetical protein